MSQYGPILNGTYGLSENYGMNGYCLNKTLNNPQNIASLLNQQTASNKNNEATEIINCLNGNFEKLLLLFTGSNDLYQKEMKRNNNNMINIDDNLDQIFYFFKNITQKLDDIENSLLNIVNTKFDLLSNNLKNIQKQFEKTVIELKTELNKIKTDNFKLNKSLDNKIDLLNINIEEVALSNSVVMQRLNLKSYETHTNVLDLKNKLKDMNKQLFTASSLKVCETEAKQESGALQFDYDVLNYSFNVENEIDSEKAENIKYTPEYDTTGDLTFSPEVLDRFFGNTSSKIDKIENKSNVIDVTCVKNNNKNKRKRKKKKRKDIKTKPPDDDCIKVHDSMNSLSCGRGIVEEIRAHKFVPFVWKETFSKV